MSAANKSTTDAATAQNDKSIDVNAQLKSTAAGALEEDDEFEEFAAEDWEEEDQEEGDVNNWADNWDDDDLEDDFSNQLRAELEATTQPSAMSVSN
ncbi:hypothetical protein LPJ64_004245 [Coemansia asiatica]|uniref:26S proteasome complex subunit SEM1 n=1 Tax=Coemansia asiatica TaxID=1052880 RepID=A0A9W7XIR3_9FUNG|nr:hypothetical protein LPJ64_004245 [Coemansia asiatica]